MLNPLLRPLLRTVMRPLLGDRYIDQTEEKRHQFDVSSLFTDGVNGVLFDPSDMAALFQDEAGTVPVDAVEQPVGLMLDKSGRGNHAYQSTLYRRPILSARYNLYTGTESLATQSITTAAASYKLSFSGTGSITLSGSATGTYTAGTHTIDCSAGTLTSTVDGVVTKADIRMANDALGQPSYQRVNTKSDYDTAGFKPYLVFNGASSMRTRNVDLSYGDNVFVSAGVRKLSNSPTGIIAEFGPSSASTIHTFRITEAISGAADYNFASRGSGTLADASCTPGTYPTHTTNIVSGIGSISGRQSILRVNMVEVASNNASQGAGNYANYPFYIGARSGSNLFFLGHLYGLVIAGKQPSDSEIAGTESYLNHKTAAY